MQANSYRLTTPTVGMINTGSGRILVTVPRRAVIKVVDRLHDANRMIRVMWEDKTVMMFTQDVRERGEKIPYSK
jgi:hypothetical protein